jgi:signal transduction histidine kinase
VDVAIPVIVATPYWETGWFRVGGSLLLALVVVLGVRAYLLNIRTQNRRLEELVQQRTTTLRQTNERLHQEIVQREKVEAALAQKAAEEAVAAERSRLARDLHDAVTQTLFATSLIAEVLPRLWERNPEAGKQKIAEIRELTRGALAEMRTLLMELRPTALMDVPLPDLLQQLSEAFTGRARVPVKLDIEKPVDLPSNVKIGFYRIAQEALNNIQKHSRATQVEICMQDQGSQVMLSITDNGVGFDLGRKLPDHFGLGIMEERAQAFGGQYKINSQPGEGTKITVTWDKNE